MGEKLKNLTKKQKTVSLLVGIILIAFIEIIIFMGVTEHNKIDLSNDFTVNVEGLDTQGTASYQINEKNLEMTLLDRNIDEFRADIFVQSVKCNLSKQEMLKNGDKITATLTFDNSVAKQLNLSFKNTEKTIEVSGLPKGEVKDAFKDLKVSYTGISPDGNVSITNTSNDPFISKIVFSPSKDKVANGDKIQISANYDADEAVEHRTLIKNNVKTYTVSGLPEYISRANQLGTNELKDLKAMSDDIIRDNLKVSIPFFINHIPNRKTSQFFTLGDEYSYKNIQMSKAYIYTMKNNSNNMVTLFNHNSVCTLSDVDIVVNGNIVGTTYMIAEIDDVVLNNGKLTGDEKDAGQQNTFDEAQQAAENYFGGTQCNVEPINVEKN